jgi:hypothetical protein
MHIECGTCSTRLTLDLSWTNPSERNLEMGHEMLRQGTITKEDGSYLHNRNGVYISHQEDTINTILTDDSKRLAGCCGLDGCDGPNLRCENCKSYVATKMTDCWMSHCVAFEPIASREVE